MRLCFDREPLQPNRKLWKSGACSICDTKLDFGEVAVSHMSSFLPTRSPPPPTSSSDSSTLACVLGPYGAVACRAAWTSGIVESCIRPLDCDEPRTDKSQSQERVHGGGVGGGGGFLPIARDLSLVRRLCLFLGRYSSPGGRVGWVVN